MCKCQNCNCSKLNVIKTAITLVYECAKCGLIFTPKESAE